MMAHAVVGKTGQSGLPSQYIIRLGIGGFFAMNVMMVSWAMYADKLSFLFQPDSSSVISLRYAALVLSLPVILLLGIPYARSAFAEVRQFRLGFDALIAAGAGAAFLQSTLATVLNLTQPIYFDTAVMILFLVTLGRYLEAHARQRAASEAGVLSEKQPAKARIVRNNEEFLEDAAAVSVGDFLRVLPGELVPVDGVVVSGSSSVIQSILTGESAPVPVCEGTSVLGGSLNGEGAFTLRAIRTADAMYLRQIENLALRALSTRGPSMQIADVLARWLTPLVLVLGLTTGLVHGLAAGPWEGLFRCLSVVLIACPCALGIGANLAASIGFGRALRKGVLFRSFSAIERTAKIDSVYFDKTGTITSGNSNIRLKPASGSSRFSEDLLWGIAASVCRSSTHPMSLAIVEEAQRLGVRVFCTENVRQVPGIGIAGDVVLSDGGMHRVSVERGEVPLESSTEETDVFSLYKDTKRYTSISCLVVDKEKIAIFLSSEEIRPHARETMQELRNMGLEISLLSGDRPEAVEELAAMVGVQKAFSRMLPEEKLYLIAKAQEEGRRVLMVGDGVNDAPALGAANVGVAFGRGVDSIRLVADVLIPKPDLKMIPWCVLWSRRIAKAIKWNLFWAVGYNVVGLGFAACGFFHPVISAGLMAASSLMVSASSVLLVGERADFLEQGVE